MRVSEAELDEPRGAASAACRLAGRARRGRPRAPDDDPRAAAERFELLADAAWWLGRLDECIEHREAAYRAYDELGDDRRAGQCAVWLYEHYCFKARPAIAGAWLQRARRSLEGDTECVEYGALRAARGGGRTRQGRARGRGRRWQPRWSSSAGGCGRPISRPRRCRRSGGCSSTTATRSTGIAHLDEAMLFAVEGRLRPYSTGKVYCSLISACEELGDFAAPRSGREATARWAGGHPFAVFPGVCRVHRASRTQLAGRAGRGRARSRAGVHGADRRSTCPTPPPPTRRSVTSAAGSAISTAPRRRSRGPRSCAGRTCPGTRVAAPRPGPGRRGARHHRRLPRRRRLEPARSGQAAPRPRADRDRRR